MHVSFLEADQVLKERLPAVHDHRLGLFYLSPPAEQGISLQPRARPADVHRESGAGGCELSTAHWHTVALFSLARHCALRPKPKSE